MPDSESVIVVFIMIGGVWGTFEEYNEISSGSGDVIFFIKFFLLELGARVLGEVDLLKYIV